MTHELELPLFSCCWLIHSLHGPARLAAVQHLLFAGILASTSFHVWTCHVTTVRVRHRSGLLVCLMSWMPWITWVCVEHGSVCWLMHLAKVVTLSSRTCVWSGDNLCPSACLCVESLCAETLSRSSHTDSQPQKSNKRSHLRFTPQQVSLFCAVPHPQMQHYGDLQCSFGVHTISH
jgi:hypothetical protein